MKERPILFSGAMVRALLDGSKTQTRRVAKYPIAPHFCEMQGGGVAFCEWEGTPCCGTGVWEVPYHSAKVTCPYGQPGDRLYVRETWSSDFACHYPFDRVWYAADDDHRHEIEVRDGVRGIYSPESATHIPFRWHPSIHMPRTASRITLEVSGVRVERLQDISEADAIAEGIELSRASFMPQGFRLYDHADKTFSVDAIASYRTLWESINGNGSWDANPWVWVVEFHRLQP